MRIKGRRESKNIEDQRGLPPAKSPYLEKMPAWVPPSPLPRMSPKKPLPPATSKKTR